MGPQIRAPFDRVGSPGVRPVGRVLEGLLELIEVCERISDVEAGDRAVEVHLRQTIRKWIMTLVDTRNSNVLRRAEAYIRLREIAAKPREPETPFPDQIRPHHASKRQGKILNRGTPDLGLRSETRAALNSAEDWGC